MEALKKNESRKNFEMETQENIVTTNFTHKNKSLEK